MPLRHRLRLLRLPSLLLPLLPLLLAAASCAAAAAAVSGGTPVLGGRLYDQGLGSTPPAAVTLPTSSSSSSGSSSSSMQLRTPLWPPALVQHAQAPAPRSTGAVGAGAAVSASGRVPLGAVAGMTLVMALASSLGALPFFLFGSLSRPWAALANSIASGVMLAASFGLLHEGAPHGGVTLVGGMLLGAAFVKLSQEYLERYEVESFEELRGADARRVILFLAVMAAHAVGEGSGVGVSFSGERGWAAGTTVTLAIGLHNVPEGLAVATVLAARGASPRRLLLWTTLTALPQALVALPSFLFVEAFAALLPLAMGFAAGCMVWIVAAELLPDALEGLPHPTVATAVTAAAAWLQGLAVFIEHLEGSNSASSSTPGLQLAPLALTCLVPGVSAGLAATLLPSRPAALAASAGALAASGAAAALWLLAHGSQRAAATLLYSAAGAGGALLLWRELMPVTACGGGGGDVHGSGGSGSWRGSKEAGDEDCLEAGVQLQPPSANLQQGSWQCADVHHRRAHGSTAAAASSAAGSGGVHLHHAQPQEAWRGGGSGVLAPPAPPHAWIGADPPSPVHGRGWAVATVAGLPRSDSLSRAGSIDLKQQLQRASSGSGGVLVSWSTTGRAAAAGAAATAILAASRGVALGGALLAAGAGSGWLALQMALAAVVQGLACAGALSAAVGGSTRRVGVLAVMINAVGPATALALALVGPAAYANSSSGGGGGGGAAAAAAAYSSAGEALLAVSAGWSVLTGIRLLLPQARAWHSARARAGFMLGAALALAASVAGAAMCVGGRTCLGGPVAAAAQS